MEKTNPRTAVQAGLAISWNYKDLLPFLPEWSFLSAVWFNSHVWDILFRFAETKPGSNAIKTCFMLFANETSPLRSFYFFPAKFRAQLLKKIQSSFSSFLSFLLSGQAGPRGALRYQQVERKSAIALSALTFSRYKKPTQMSR